MVMLGSVVIWHAIVPSLSQNIVDDVDHWVLLGLGAIFICAHVTFFAFIYFKVSIVR